MKITKSDLDRDNFYAASASLISESEIEIEGGLGWVKFRGSVSSKKFIFAEAGRRTSKYRSGPRPKARVVRTCSFCKEPFTAREMRAHVAEAHPGGRRKHLVVWPESRAETPCDFCGKPLNAYNRTLHLRRHETGFYKTKKKV